MAQIFTRLWFSPEGGHSELPGDKTSQRGTVPLRGGRLTPMHLVPAHPPTMQAHLQPLHQFHLPFMQIHPAPAAHPPTMQASSSCRRKTPAHRHIFNPLVSPTFLSCTPITMQAGLQFPHQPQKGIFRCPIATGKLCVSVSSSNN